MSTGAPPEARDWRVPALVALVVVVPVLVLLQAGRARQPIPEVAMQTGLIAYLTLFASAVLVSFSWRVTRADALGWIAAGMGIAAVQGLALNARALVGTTSLARAEEWLIVVHLGLVLTLVGVVIAARYRRLTLDPIAIGVLGGAAFALLRWRLVESSLNLRLPPGVVVVLMLMLCGACLALFLAVMALSTVPAWARIQIGGVVVLLSVAFLISFPVPEGTARSSVTLSAHLVAAVLVGSTSFAMLRVAVREERQALSGLREQLVYLEAIARIDRARMHQIGATVAGIHTASHVLDVGQGILPSKRSSLTQMMRAEIARLDRLVAGRIRPVPCEVDVDTAIEPIVVRQRAQGQRVEWTPSGFRVWARSDELAEAVSTLLENADRHAPGSQVFIRARDADGFVEISVSDSGPGVQSHLAERVFVWGYSSPGSQGQGIGLAVARQLLEDVDGYLRCDTTGPGGRFVLGLQHSETRPTEVTGE